MKLRTERLTVPPDAGVDGCLRLLRRCLVRPRVQTVQINARLGIECTFYGEPEEVFLPPTKEGASEDTPYNDVQGADMVVMPEQLDCFKALSAFFEQMGRDRLYMVGFLVNPQSFLWQWAGLERGHLLFGHVVYMDDQIPPHQVVGLGAIAPDAALLSVERGYVMSTPIDWEKAE